MEFNGGGNNLNKELILPDADVLMEIKTEPEIIIERDSEPEIYGMLREVIQGQKELSERLDRIEQNQTSILENQNILNNEQAAIVSNHLQIAAKIKRMETNIVSKRERIAQMKTLTECKLSIRRVEQLICKTGSESYDKQIDEIAKMLPLQSLADVAELEEKLEKPDFTEAIIAYLNKMKGISEDVGSVIRSIFTDDLLEKYNWDGRWEKQALGKLILFNKILRDVFQQGGAYEYERRVKKAVERSHHRSKQKKFLRK